MDGCFLCMDGCVFLYGWVFFLYGWVFFVYGWVHVFVYGWVYMSMTPMTPMTHACTPLLSPRTSADNLELGCSLIERAAMEKAVREIDERLSAEIAARQKAKAAGVPFADTNAAAVPPNMPETLRPKGGALSAFQSRVYDDFARIPQPMGPLAARPAAPATAPPMGVTRDAVGRPAPPAAASEAQAAFPGEAPAVAALLWEKLGMWMAQMEVAMAKDPHVLFGQMPEGSDVPVLVAALPDITKLGSNPEKIALGVALKVCGVWETHNAYHTWGNSFGKITKHIHSTVTTIHHLHPLHHTDLPVVAERHAHTCAAHLYGGCNGCIERCCLPQAAP